MSALKLFSFTSSCLTRSGFRQANNKFLLPTGLSNFTKNFINSSAPRQYTLTYPINGKFKFSPVTTALDSKKFSSSAPKTPNPSDQSRKSTTKANPINADDLIFGECSKLTQFQKFKLMYKKYWYVLIPVHIVTSAGWIFGFYYLSKSGVDIPQALQYIHISEDLIDRVKHSNMGHYAIAYLCYKVITPLRYAVSLGLTTISIKRLVFAGYIKPIPTKKEFIQMYENKKAIRARRKEELKNEKE